MATNTFDKFVKKQVAQAKNLRTKYEINSTQRREQWLRDLNELYSSMEKFLKKYTDADKISISRKSVKLTEENIGTYETDQLTFTIGTRKVVAKPIGTLLIGSKGRVDLLGVRGSIRIVLLDKGGPAINTRVQFSGEIVEDYSSSLLPNNNVDREGWYIASSPPNITTTAFNKESFLDAIMEISDG